MTQFKNHNQKFVFSVTGGGSLFISKVLTAGGASNFLVHAVVPYNQASLERFVGGVREKCCSESTARQMAIAGEKYAKELGINAIGVGATCSLSRGEDEREEREHKIYVAATYREHAIALEWIHKLQKYTRQEEEGIAAALINDLSEIFAHYINEKSHMVEVDLKNMTRNLTLGRFFSEIKITLPSDLAKEKISSLNSANQSMKFLGQEAFKNFYKAKDNTVCIFPGSYNPVHQAHIENFRSCEKLYGAENCFLEVSISNCEKPQIDSIELTNRIAGMRKVTENIIITNKPMFKGKIDEIKSALGEKTKIVFGVGYDTYIRIEKIEGSSFLVFPRNGKNAFDASEKNLNKIEPESFQLTKSLDMSSSSIRKRA